MPQVVIPVQRETAMHASVTWRYTFAWAAPEPPTSSSVISTSTPRSAKRCRFAW